MPRDGSLRPLDGAIPAEAPAAILRRAAAILRERGHQKGAFTGAGGTVCAVTAIQMARGEGLPDFVGDAPAPYPHLLRHLGLREGFVDSLCEWNNEDGRTGEDVARAFEQAAEMMEAEHAV